MSDTTAGASAPAWLRERAESYSRDAMVLRRDGDKDGAIVYETIRDELRRCAALLGDGLNDSLAEAAALRAAIRAADRALYGDGKHPKDVEYHEALAPLWHAARFSGPKDGESP